MDHRVKELFHEWYDELLERMNDQDGCSVPMVEVKAAIGEITLKDGRIGQVQVTITTDKKHFLTNK